MLPFSSKFSDNTKNNPDLYGPFWIMTTIIFALAVIGNFREYLLTPNGAEFNSNYQMLSEAASLIYSIGLGVPTIIYFLWKCTGELTISYLHVVSIYGYSMTIFVPMIMLCAIPLNFLQWVFLITGSIFSIQFLISNYKKYIFQTFQIII